MRASDMHAVLGRLLDHVRMADLPVNELSVRADRGEYALRLFLDTADREAVARLARRTAGIVGVTGLTLTEEGAPSKPAPSALRRVEAA